MKKTDTSDLDGWHAADTPADGYASEGELNVSKLVHAQNKKKKGGGFQSFGLSYPVLKGVLKKGYNVPTPVQRKTIPLILEGKDVVAMARTGSGKTAAFLLPLFEKLKVHSSKIGARAMIVSPTRELALQTLNFAKELGRFTGLRATLVVGGEKIETQFSALHENPDIILATPGRFTHICAEMNLNLKSVEYVVFDEADRLFEMGFKEQLSEILARLSPVRQTLLFSATLPKVLVEFARAGLSDPTLVRLDVDTKIPESLKLGFFKVDNESKIALLIHILKNVTLSTDLTVIFVATKHHVEYVHEVLNEVGIPSTYVFSSLIPTARKINIAKFRTRRVRVMVVTDVAARGLDIPLLDNVINMNFPPTTKLFVHRVGRVARAGREGVAYSMVAPDEISYLLDLHMFLSRSVKFCPMTYGTSAGAKTHSLSFDPSEWDRYLGKVPQEILDDNMESIRVLLGKSFELKTLAKTANNAFLKYSKTRPAPSTESIRRIKEDFWGVDVGVHPLFKGFGQSSIEDERMKLLEKLKNVRPSDTIFEIRKSNADTKANNKSALVMDQIRKLDEGKIEKFHSKMNRKKALLKEMNEKELIANEEKKFVEQSSEYDLETTFKSVVGRNSVKRTAEYSSPAGFGSSSFRDHDSKNENGAFQGQQFIPYLPSDHYDEKNYSVMSKFHQEIESATLDLAGDNYLDKKKNSNVKWDRNQKKFKGKDAAKMIKTESGVWIPATYKKDLYRKWRLKNQIVEKTQGEEEEQDAFPEDRGQDRKRRKRHEPGFINLNERASRGKTHPLLQGKLEARMKCPKKGQLQVRTFEERTKLIKQKKKRKEFHKSRETFRKNAKRKNSNRRKK